MTIRSTWLAGVAAGAISMIAASSGPAVEIEYWQYFF
jgi:hypothetical protein